MFLFELEKGRKKYSVEKYFWIMKTMKVNKNAFIWYFIPFVYFMYVYILLL